MFYPCVLFRMDIFFSIPASGVRRGPGRTVSLKIISLFFLILYSSYVFRIVFPLIDYVVNYSFIVHELCEQKDNLDNLCMGKCHLQKEIKRIAETLIIGNNINAYR